MIMNCNRALWQAAKLEMKGKLIVLDLMEFALGQGMCICVYMLGIAEAWFAGVSQMWHTAESHARLPLCLGLSF